LAKKKNDLSIFFTRFRSGQLNHTFEMFSTSEAIFAYKAKGLLFYLTAHNAVGIRSFENWRLKSNLLSNTEKLLGSNSKQNQC